MDDGSWNQARMPGAAHTRVDIAQQSVWSQANEFSCMPCFSAAVKVIFHLLGPPVGAGAPLCPQLV